MKDQPQYLYASDIEKYLRHLARNHTPLEFEFVRMMAPARPGFESRALGVFARVKGEKYYFDIAEFRNLWGDAPDTFRTHCEYLRLVPDEPSLLRLWRWPTLPSAFQEDIELVVEVL